jgi:signal transduction histidine kinase
MLGHVHGVDVQLHTDGASNGSDRDSDRDRARQFAALRIAHEALHNALHHAHARHVEVRLTHPGGAVVVEVRDDGVGFEPQRPELRSRHLGLTSMEERARELGGRLEIRSAPGAGTTVRLEFGADD